jgi:hypothetical protein
MNNLALQQLLGTHVVELEFTRRHPKLGWSDIRGLFGTTNPELLNSDFGFQVFHFRPPTGAGMSYDYESKGLCVVWDIFRQDFRVFGSEQISWHRKWPLTTEDEIEEFKQYFYDYIVNLSEDNKLKFMGYIGMEQAKPKTGIPSSPTAVSKWKNVMKALQNKSQGFINAWKKFFGKT